MLEMLDYAGLLEGTRVSRVVPAPSLIVNRYTLVLFGSISSVFWPHPARCHYPYLVPCFVFYIFTPLV